MVVTICSGSVIDSVLAASALAAIGSGDAEPVLLTPDHTPALQAAMRPAFRAVAMRLAPYLESADVSGDSCRLEFAAGMALDAVRAGTMVEDVVAASVLSLFHAQASPELSSAYGAQSERALRLLHGYIMACAYPGGVRITPHSV